MGYFKVKHFKKDIILIAVGYYCCFSLSYRDVSEILKERGIKNKKEPLTTHTTGIIRGSPIFKQYYPFTSE